MFTQRQMYLQKGLFSAVAMLLLLTTAGQCTVLQTTESTSLTNVSLTSEFNNSTMEEPLVLRLHRPCRTEHKEYCQNGGQCMYPQDSDKPSCICTSSFSGPRCLFYNEASHSLPDLEKVIAISFGIIMLIIILVIVIYCFAKKSCEKSAQLIKSEILV